MSWIKTLDRQDWVHLNGGIGCRHPMLVFSSPPRKTRWWFSTIFYFHPEFWEDEPILTSIFSRWVGSTTNENNTTPISDGSKKRPGELAPSVGNHPRIHCTADGLLPGGGWNRKRVGAAPKRCVSNGSAKWPRRKDNGHFFFFGGGMEEETCHLRCCFGDQNIGGLYIFFSILHFCGWYTHSFQKNYRFSVS